MAAAIPAGIGLGSSIISGISGKGAQKKQQQLLEQQRRDLLPLLQAQTQGIQFSLDKARQYFDPAAQMFQGLFGQSQDMFGKAGQAADTAFKDYGTLLKNALSRSDQLFGQGQGLVGQGQNLLQGSLPYLAGAGTALQDLQKFYRPFMFDAQRAIDKFLPSASRVNQLLAPEFGNINQGFQSASENIAKFAPRGGGRVSTMARADVDRQKQLSDVFFRGREGLADRALSSAFQAAAGEGSRASALQALGLGQGQLGLGTIGEGRGLIGAGTAELGTGGGLAQQAFGQGLGALGLGLNALQSGQGSAQGLGGLATFGLGQGLNSGGNIYDMFNQQANRLNNLDVQALRNQSGTKGMGGYLVDLFSNKSVQDKIGGFFGNIFGGGGGSGGTKNMFLTAPYDPFKNQLKDFLG